MPNPWKCTRVSVVAYRPFVWYSFVFRWSVKCGIFMSVFLCKSPSEHNYLLNLVYLCISFHVICVNRISADSHFILSLHVLFMKFPRHNNELEWNKIILNLSYLLMRFSSHTCTSKSIFSDKIIKDIYMIWIWYWSRLK